MDASTRLPWDVIERVIHHCRGCSSTLCSFSLTCRELLRRSRLVMFARVRFKSRDHIFAFVDFLQDNPHLKPVVRSIAVRPVYLAPFPRVFHILPSLSGVEFVPDADQSPFRDVFPDLRPSTFLHHHRFATNVKTLRFACVRFTTCFAFAQALVAFPKVEHLTCEDVKIEAKGDEGPMDVTRRRLSNQMQLKALTIDSSSLTGDGRGAHLSELLFHPYLAPSTVQSLKLVEVSGLGDLPLQPGWSQLRSLVLQLRQLGEGAECLDNFLSAPRLSEVTLEHHLSSIAGLAAELISYGVQQQRYRELEQVLLKFPLAKFICIVRNPVRANSLSFWGCELRERLPVLHQRSAVVLKCEEEARPPGHEGKICALVISPDSKWVATGSDDSTIILWRSDDGTIAQQWVAHGYKPVLSLAFSPDSRQLVSGGDDGKARIWDLSRGADKVSVLEGQMGAVLTCAWSPDGGTIATGSADGSTRLWDAGTWALQLTCRQVGANTGVACLAFSPDGCWLAYGPSSRECNILNLTLPPMHKSLWSYPPEVDDPHGPRQSHASSCAIAFDPHSTRFAAAAFGSRGITVVDVKTGRKLLCLEDEGLESLQDVVFSPDGKLMLGALTMVGMEMVYVWHASSGVQRLALRGHADAVRKARFSPCGDYIASASDDRTVRLWRARDGSSMATFFEHQDHVDHLAFSLDGKILSSGSSEGTVVIRRMDDFDLADELEQGLQNQPAGHPSPPEARSSPSLPTSSGLLPRSRFAIVIVHPARLPWEVIERIIDHSAAHTDVLCSLSLSCRQLRPRCRRIMFSQVSLKNRDRVFGFVDFLRANPELKPLVHTIVTSPASFGPSLLYMLPNLSSIHCISSKVRTQPSIPLRHISLACFRQLGARIETLHLSDLCFSTPLALTQLLSAFTCLTHLTCKHVDIERASNETTLDGLKRRLSKQMCLKTLTIDSQSLTIGDHGACPGGLLLQSDLAPSTVECLRLIEVPPSGLLPYRSHWSRLRCLVLHLRHLCEGVELLENLPKAPSLSEVTLEWKRLSVRDLAVDLSLDGTESGDLEYEKLEHSLLRFSQPKITCTVQTQSASSPSCWTRELRKHFPVLFQRGAVVLQYAQVVPAGHDDKVQVLVVSPDGKWVASGSRDCTIILWDVNSGAIVHQWVAHGYKAVSSLEFSPDSRCLLSGGWDKKAAIWDLSRGARLAVVLGGHTGPVSRCAWSSSGNVLATASTNSGQVWDARTFRQLGLCHVKGVVNRLSFSADERWLICRSTERDCSILNVALSRLHDKPAPEPVVSSSTSHGSHCRPQDPHYHFTRAVPAVLDPEIMRLTFGPSDKTTVELLLKHEEPWDMHDVSFSSDGKLVVGTETRNSETIYVWDASTHAKVLVLEGHTVAVRKTCFSPCGEYIASASDDWTVKLWRTNDGRCLATFSDHKDCVEQVAFSPDGQTLSSGSNDGMVVIRQMHDINPTDGEDLQSQPSSPRTASIVDPSRNLTSTLDDHAGRSSYNKLDNSADLDYSPVLEKSPELEACAQDIGGNAPGSGQRGQPKPIAGVSPRLDQESENAEADGWMANYGGSRSDSPTEDYESAGSYSSMADYESVRSDSSISDYESVGSYSPTEDDENAHSDSSISDYESAWSYSPTVDHGSAESYSAMADYESAEMDGWMADDDGTEVDSWIADNNSARPTSRSSSISNSPIV